MYTEYNNNEAIINKINEIEKEVSNTINEDNVDKKRLANLRMKQLMIGLLLNNINIRQNY